MPLPEMKNDPGYEKRRSLKERIYLANQAAARLYHQNLWDKQGEEVLAYLKGRGLTDAVIRRFGIGAATGSLRIGDALEKEGFTQEELLAAGLTRKREQKTAGYVLPARDVPHHRRVRKRAGLRRARDGRRKPKYLNTADTPAFNKRYHVFAANLLRKEKGLKRVILVEGYMDVVALSQFGVGGVAATLGTALTQEQARLLSRFAPEIHLCYDGDAAGQNAILRGLEVLESQRIKTRVLDIPGGLDPDEFIRQNGTDAFLQLEAPLPRQLPHPAGKGEVRPGRGGRAHRVRQGLREDFKIRTRTRGTGKPFEAACRRHRIHARSAFESRWAQPKRPAIPTRPNASGFRRSREGRETCGYARKHGARTAGRRASCPNDLVTPGDFDDPDLRLIAEALLKGQTLGALLDENATDSLRQAVGAILSIEIDDEQAMNMAQECFEQAKRAKLEKELEEIERRVQNYSNEDPQKQEQLQRSLDIMQQLKTLEVIPQRPSLTHEGVMDVEQQFA